jgi:hypothetical protein
MPTGTLPPLNYLSIGTEGTFLTSGAHPSSPDDVDALVDHLRQRGTKRLALYFHGGLVPGDAAMKSAAALEPDFTSAGVHPLMFIWHTGLGETLRGNLTGLAATDLFKLLLKIALKRAAKHLGIDRDAKGAPVDLTDAAIEAELAKDEPFAGFAPSQPDASARGGATGAGSDKLLLEQIQAEIEEDLADSDAEKHLSDPKQAARLDPPLKAAVSSALESRGAIVVTVATYLGPAVFRVVKRYWQHRQHDFVPTVVEELLRVAFLANLGATLWGDMRRSAAGMWKSNGAASIAPQHAGRFLLDRLPALIAAGLELDLIGHSAGSIAICEMLQAAASAGIALPVRNIILVAPAVTAKMLWDEIASRPERCRRFRMFTMSDAYETRDHLVRGVYPRSLLYLISGILEAEADCPIAGLERHLTGRDPYAGSALEGLHRFLYEPGANRLVLSVASAGGGGLRASATEHGGFAHDPLVRESIGHLLRS